MSETSDDLALDMMQAGRPDVRREVLADFLAGRIANTPYLHVSPDEFRRMAAWADALRAAKRKRP